MFLELDVWVYSSFDLSSTTGFKFNSLRASLLTVLFGLVQARPWFRSSVWISSIAGISKVLCTSEVVSATRTWQYGAESEDDQSQTLFGLAY